jgi:hypothetical protein
MHVSFDSSDMIVDDMRSFLFPAHGLWKDTRVYHSSDRRDTREGLESTSFR